MEMKESINACCTTEAKLKPEEEIRCLKRELRDANARAKEVQEELNRKTIQVQGLTDVMLDLRRYTKDLESSAKWDAKRMDDYCSAITDIYCKCAEVVDTFGDLPSDEMALSEREYELAKTIYEIVRRF